MRRYGGDYGARGGWGNYGDPGADYWSYTGRSGGYGQQGWYDGGYGLAGWGDVDDTTGRGYSTAAVSGYSGVGIERDWRSGRPMGGGADADRVRAGDIMTPDPETVAPDTPLNEVAARMRDLDVGIIPVVEEGNRLIGVITDRDIVVRAAAEGKDVKKSRARDYMTTDVDTVSENSSVRDVFSVMKRERVRRVPVTGPEGRLVGIIAQADLAVDYAGLDLQRETEVEEVLERISEPASPEWSRRSWGGGGYDQGYDRGPDLGDRVRQGWHTLRRGARNLVGRGYDRGYHRGYDRGWGGGWR